MAYMNKKPMPDLEKIRRKMEEDRDFMARQTSGKIYSVVDLFRTRKFLKITLLFSFIWLSGMFAYFGIAFNVPQLSGSLYMNMFLVTVVDLPGPVIIAVLNIKFGRKWTSFGLTGISGVLILVAGALEASGLDFTTLVRVFVMTSKLTCNAAWYAFAVWTLESYPTVIRHIGRGTVECISRIGAMVAPQFISLSLQIPGLLYFVCGVLMVLAGATCIFLEETKDSDLDDLLPQKSKKHEDIVEPVKL